MAKKPSKSAQTPAELAERGPAEKPASEKIVPYDTTNIPLLISAVIEDFLILVLWLSQISPDKPDAREAAGRLDATRRKLCREEGVPVTELHDPRKRWLHEYPEEEDV